MTYYAFIEENKINGKGQCRCLNDDVINKEITQEQFENIEKYIYEDGEIVLDPNYKEKQKQKERERIAQLTMTALDLISCIQKEGLSLGQINNFLEENIPLKMQLTYCQNIYCHVVCGICPITIDGVKITEEKVISWFKDKEGK